jgi:hypothetical protein
MIKNMGVIDRVIRVIIAIAIAVLIYKGVLIGIPAIIVGILGGVFLLTSIIGMCPLYIPFKISTKKK